MASTLTVDTIQGSTNANNVKLPKGCIVQVEQTFYDDVATTFASTDGDVTLFSVNITPKFATSKILVTIDINVSHIDSYSALIRCKRDSTYIGGGQLFASNYNNQFTNVWFNIRTASSNGAYANSVTPCSQSFLDSPATTSQLTYTVMARQSGAATKAGRINNPVDFGNYAYSSPAASTITVMEIAQ